MAFFRLFFRQSLHRSPILILASCYAFCIGRIMAHRNTLPCDPSFLLDYLEQLPYGSDSDGDEFEGYLGPAGGPVIIRNIDSASYEDQEPPPSPCNSHLLYKMLKPL